MAKKAIPPTPDTAKTSGKGAPPPFVKGKGGAPPFPPKRAAKSGGGKMCAACKKSGAASCSHM